MIACLCNNFNDSDLKTAYTLGARTPESVHSCLGKTPNCRKCFPYIQEKINDLTHEHLKKELSESS